jgi:hypothetical protein
MSQPAEPSADPEAFAVYRSRPAGRSLGGCLGRPLRVVGGLCLLLVIGILGPLFLVEVPLRLAFGWIAFLRRALPQIDWHLPAIATGLIALGGFVVGAQLLARQLWRQRAAAVGAWRWRWTLGGSAMLLLLFAAGTAMVGIVHQTIWVATSDQPFLEAEGFGGGRQRAQLHATLEVLQREHGADAAALRRALAAVGELRALELRLAVPAGPDGGAAAGLLQFPDTPQIDRSLQGRSFVCTLGDGGVGAMEPVPAERLSALVAAVAAGEPW